MDPIDKQSAMFLTKKRRMEAVKEALDYAATQIVNGKFNDALLEVFSSDKFGPEPAVSFKVLVRRDPSTPGRFAVSCGMKVDHFIGDGQTFHGLKPE